MLTTHDRRPARGARFAWWGGCLAAIITLWAAPGFADGDPRTDQVARYVPYRGSIELDGAALDDVDVTMEFRLYSPDQSGPVWTESQSVPVVEGHFTALLGVTSRLQADALREVLAGADALELEVDVDAGAGPVTMTARKPFRPAPYAFWSTAGTDVTIGDRLVVESDVAVSASEAPVLLTDGDGNTLAIGASAILAVGPSETLGLNRASGQAVTVGGGLNIVGDTTTALSFAGGTALQYAAEGGSEVMILNPGGALGTTTITGDLEVSGAVTGVTATLTLVSCTTGNRGACDEDLSEVFIGYEHDDTCCALSVTVDVPD